MTVTISFAGDSQAACVEKMRDFLGYDKEVKSIPAQEPATEEDEKPKPKPKTRKAAKPEPEPEQEAADPDEEYDAPKKKRGDKIDFEDITAAAGELIKACQGDMKRAQELVYSEFGVRKVSKIAVAEYPKAHRWMLDIANQMIENGSED
jgi:outer membrane biosynthesis protein TonB